MWWGLLPVVGADDRQMMTPLDSACLLDVDGADVLGDRRPRELEVSRGGGEGEDGVELGEDRLRGTELRQPRDQLLLEVAQQLGL